MHTDAQRLPQLEHTATGYRPPRPAGLERRFLYAESFHLPERLAAVRDESGAYHIDPDGRPAYAQRYRIAHGFYGGLAAVCDDSGWFHIDATGRPAYAHRWLWAGNVQEQRCVVQDERGFLHIRPDGSPLYEARYRYAGDYRYGVAVVRDERGAFAIDREGRPLHELRLAALDVYHKGYARARDARGWFHIDAAGTPCYEHRFQDLEPFYNGWALATTHDGHPVRVRPHGFYLHLPRNTAPRTPHELRQRASTDRRLALVLRHAERPPIRHGWGDEVLLTPRGHAQARALGNLLATAPVREVFTSPIGRCVQTAEALVRGFDPAQAVAIRRTQLLGDPGPFRDSTYRGPQSPPHRFSALVDTYFVEGRAPGMLPLETACEALLEGICARSGPGLTVFVTHDLFVAGLMRFTGLAPRWPGAAWPGFLHGVVIEIERERRWRQIWPFRPDTEHGTC